MANWNSTAGVVEAWAPRVHPFHAGWAMVDCGCCAGIQWGGEAPVECSTCGAGGWLHVHLASGRTAWWPGGPFSGSLGGDELERVRAAVARA